MDVLLINPSWIKGKGNIWKGISACLPPPGLGYIGAVLEQKGVNVKIFDANAEGNYNELKLINGLKSMNISPDFIGITATTSIIQNALDMAAICKRVFLNPPLFSEVFMPQFYLKMCFIMITLIMLFVGRERTVSGN